MIIKKCALGSIMAMFSLSFVHCGDEQEVVDCDVTDLSVQVVSATQPYCIKAGTVQLEATGGSGDYTFRIDGFGARSTGLFENLPAGNYEFSVNDKSGCTAFLDFSLEEKLTDLTFELTQQEAGCGSADGYLSWSVAGGTAPYEVKLDGEVVEYDELEDLSSSSFELEVTDAAGCYIKESVNVLSGVSLAGDIMPIMNLKCASGTTCHLQGSELRLVFEERPEAVISNAKAIKTQTQSRNMPKSGSLTQEQIDMIACWVDDGAPDN